MLDLEERRDVSKQKCVLYVTVPLMTGSSTHQMAQKPKVKWSHLDHVLLPDVTVLLELYKPHAFVYINVFLDPLGVIRCETSVLNLVEDRRHR